MSLPTKLIFFVIFLLSSSHAAPIVSKNNCELCININYATFNCCPTGPLSTTGRSDERLKLIYFKKTVFSFVFYEYSNRIYTRKDSLFSSFLLLFFGVSYCLCRVDQRSTYIIHCSCKMLTLFYNILEILTTT